MLLPDSSLRSLQFLIGLLLNDDSEAFSAVTPPPPHHRAPAAIPGRVRPAENDKD